MRRSGDAALDLFDFAMDPSVRPPRVSVPRPDFLFDDERPVSQGGSVGSGDDPRAAAPSVEPAMFARGGRLGVGYLPSPSSASPASGLDSHHELRVTGSKYGRGASPSSGGLPRRKSESAVALLRAARAITDMGADVSPRARRRTDAVHLRPIAVTASASAPRGTTSSTHAPGSRLSHGSKPEVTSSNNHVTETDSSMGTGTTPGALSIKRSPLGAPGARVGSPRHRDVLRVAAADIFRGFGGSAPPLSLDADLAPRHGAGGLGAGAGAAVGGFDAGMDHAGRSPMTLDPLSTRPNGTRLRRSMTVSHYQYQLRRRNNRAPDTRRVVTPTGRLLPPGSSLPRLRALHVMPKQVCRLVDEEANAAVRAVLEWHPDTDRALAKRPLSATRRSPLAATARARTTSLDQHRPPTPSPLSPCRRRRAISFDDHYDRAAHFVMPTASLPRSPVVREAGSGGSGANDGEAGSIGGSPGSVATGSSDDEAARPASGSDARRPAASPVDSA